MRELARPWNRHSAIRNQQSPIRTRPSNVPLPAQRVRIIRREIRMMSPEDPRSPRSWTRCSVAHKGQAAIHPSRRLTLERVKKLGERFRGVSAWWAARSLGARAAGPKACPLGRDDLATDSTIDVLCPRNTRRTFSPENHDCRA